MITAILFEEIGYIKDESETFSVVLGFSKGFIYQHIPILFSDEPSYKSFLVLISNHYHSIVSIITQDDLKVFLHKSPYEEKRKISSKTCGRRKRKYD